MQPTMTLDEFLRKFKAYTAGTIALGTANPRKLLSGKYDSPESVGEAIISLDQTTVTLLTTLYRALVPEKAPPTTKK
jgi:hypothetical protein